MNPHLAVKRQVGSVGSFGKSALVSLDLIVGVEIVDLVQLNVLLRHTCRSSYQLHIFKIIGFKRAIANDNDPPIIRVMVSFEYVC